MLQAYIHYIILYCCVDFCCFESIVAKIYHTEIDLYIHHTINNMYHNTAGIIIIFLHYVLCMIFRNNVDYMYKYSQTWKFPEQVSMYS